MRSHAASVPMRFYALPMRFYALWGTPSLTLSALVSGPFPGKSRRDRDRAPRAFLAHPGGRRTPGRDPNPNLAQVDRDPEDLAPGRPGRGPTSGDPELLRWTASTVKGLTAPLTAHLCLKLGNSSPSSNVRRSRRFAVSADSH